MKLGARPRSHISGSSTTYDLHTGSLDRLGGNCPERSISGCTYEAEAEAERSQTPRKIEKKKKRKKEKPYLIQ